MSELRMKSAQCRGIRLASVTGSLPLRSATCGEGAGRTFSRMARGASHVEDEGRRQKQSGSAAGRGVQPPPPQPVGRSSQSASSPAPRCWRLGESQRGPSALPSANISRAAQSQILLRAKCTTNCPTSSKWACLKGLPCAAHLPPGSRHRTRSRRSRRASWPALAAEPSPPPAPPPRPATGCQARRGSHLMVCVDRDVSKDRRQAKRTDEPVSLHLQGLQGIQSTAASQGNWLHGGITEGAAQGQRGRHDMRCGRDGRNCQGTRQAAKKPARPTPSRAGSRAQDPHTHSLSTAPGSAVPGSMFPDLKFPDLCPRI